MQTLQTLKQHFDTTVNNLNTVVWHDAVLYVVLGVGLLFTLWSGFCQYRALTHGVSVIRGKYDDKNDPGAINHFQALSAALSATVGLGNIAGVAVAMALGGPGAVFWMWVVALVGMALKTTEVALAMIYRDTSNPNEPHGGPMWVARKGLADGVANGAKWMGPASGLIFAIVTLAGTYLWWTAVSPSVIAAGVGVAAALVFLVLGFTNVKAIGALIGGVFCVTLLISTITGGNMFQAWSVAEITHDATNNAVPKIVVGIAMAVLTGMVIIGGIKRIGAVAGRLVPFMCAIYLLGALYVIIMRIGDVPEMLRLIVVSALPTWLGGANAEPAGAFMGGTFGYALYWGMKRALFSNEAGQGSSPIAHSAAKTDEPVREAVVAGLEPFVDTICVCTMTALVILLSGAWNRPAAAEFPSTSIQAALMPSQSLTETAPGQWSMDTPALPPTSEAIGWWHGAWRGGEVVHANLVLTRNGQRTEQPVYGIVRTDGAAAEIDWEPVASETTPVTSGDENLYFSYLLDAGDADAAGAPDTGKRRWTLSTPPVPEKTEEAKRAKRDWLANDTVFMIAWTAEIDRNTGRELVRFNGSLRIERDGRKMVDWDTTSVASAQRPALTSPGLWQNFSGPTLTAHAFNMITPGMGTWVVLAAAWLFALSTAISWSYYGEQGVVYLFGQRMIMPYKIIYCLFLAVATAGIAQTDEELDAISSLGTGIMLWANIPIMLVFGMVAMRAYSDYMRRLRSGKMESHAAPPLTEVVEGKDVE